MDLRNSRNAAVAATVFSLGGMGCMPPPPQVPCSCPPSPCETASPPSSGAPPAPVEANPRSGGEPLDLAARYEGAPALKVLHGQATYYGDSLAGNKTASGEIYDPRAFTAAHRTLPFGSVVRVVRTDRKTHDFVYVRITDRGPFGGRRRIIDLSRAAAERLDMIRDGVVDVRVEVVSYPQGS